VDYYGNKKWKDFSGKRMKEPFFTVYFTSLIQEIKSNEDGDCISANSFKKSFKQFFDPSQMHDCSEFIRFFLSNLQDESTPAKKREDPKRKSLSEKNPKICSENEKNKENELKINFNDVLQAKLAALNFWMAYRIEHPSFVDSLFGGLLESRVTCGKCGFDSITYDPFLDFALPICDGNLIDCFRLFFKKEKVEYFIFLYEIDRKILIVLFFMMKYL
jgi:ubiquitin C-terminal hydrolase